MSPSQSTWKPGAPTAPARPEISLPPDYDLVNIRKFGGEFDAVPLPDPREAAAHAKRYHRDNMEYIRSTLAASPVPPHDAFFKQMAARQWRAATPFIQRDGLARHLEKGLLPIGARRDLGPHPMVEDKSRPLMPGGYAGNWDSIPGLERVNAYAFRGDKRLPGMIKAAGGFHPPSTRTDDAYVQLIAKRFQWYMKGRFKKDVDQAEVIQYIKGQGPAGKAFVEYELWRAILKGEELHIQRMVTDEFLKGFISATREIGVTRAFNSGESQDQQDVGNMTATYALHCDGGLLLPNRPQHVHGSKGEAEIAYPGSLPWSKVMAFRFVMLRTFDRRYNVRSEVIFVRKGFRESDPAGAQEVIWCMGSA